MLVFSFAVLLKEGSLSDWCVVTEEHLLITSSSTHFDDNLKSEQDVSYQLQQNEVCKKHTLKKKKALSPKKKKNHTSHPPQSDLLVK